jgi:hypothetical protein
LDPARSAFAAAASAREQLPIIAATRAGPIFQRDEIRTADDAEIIGEENRVRDPTDQHRNCQRSASAWAAGFCGGALVPKKRATDH